MRVLATGYAWQAWPTSTATPSSRTLRASPRLATLRAATAALFPRLVTNHADAIEWTGLRPATPRGTPIIGPTRYHNLWLNTGHGALGFTLAAGSAALLASWVDGRPDPSLSGLFATSH